MPVLLLNRLSQTGIKYPVRLKEHTTNTNNINIYVGNLPLEMTENELLKEFTVFGEVVSVTIIDDKYIGSGQQRRYAYIEMASRSEGETAIANLEGKMMSNMVVNIVRALPLSNKHKAGQCQK